MRKILMALFVSTSLVLMTITPAFAEDSAAPASSEPAVTTAATTEPAGTSTTPAPAPAPTTTATAAVPEVNLLSSSITVDSTFDVFLKNLFDSIQLFTTFNADEKAALLGKIAEERLDDLKALDTTKQQELATAITKVYANTIEKLSAMAEKRKAKGKEFLTVAQILEKAAAKASEVELEGTVDEEVEDAADKAEVTAAVVSGIDPAIVQQLRDAGYGYGKIAIIYALSQESGKTVDDVQKVLEENKGLGKTAKALGDYKVGTIISKYNKDRNAEVDEDTEEDEATTEGTATVEPGKKVQKQDRVKGQSKNPVAGEEETDEADTEEPEQE